MAEATYDLTQTGQQVQNILNDANKVMGASSVTSMTTDSIILKGTDGSYHKIDKSSFTEAVRNTLATLLVNNDKGTTISQVAAINQGDFGSITVENLALVLGAQRLRVSPAPNGGVATIQLGIPRAFVMFVWVNSTLTAPPAMLMAGRNGAISIMSGNGNIVTEDKPANICVFKENDKDTFITIKNNTTFTISVFCYMIFLENY